MGDTAVNKMDKVSLIIELTLQQVRRVQMKSEIITNRDNRCNYNENPCRLMAYSVGGRGELSR